MCLCSEFSCTEAHFLVFVLMCLCSHHTTMYSICTRIPIYTFKVVYVLCSNPSYTLLSLKGIFQKVDRSGRLPPVDYTFKVMQSTSKQSPSHHNSLLDGAYLNLSPLLQKPLTIFQAQLHWGTPILCPNIWVGSHHCLSRSSPFCGAPGCLIQTSNV